MIVQVLISKNAGSGNVSAPFTPDDPVSTSANCTKACSLTVTASKCTIGTGH